MRLIGLPSRVIDADARRVFPFSTWPQVVSAWVLDARQWAPLVLVKSIAVAIVVLAALFAWHRPALWLEASGAPHWLALAFIASWMGLVVSFCVSYANGKPAGVFALAAIIERRGGPKNQTKPHAGRGRGQAPARRRRLASSGPAANGTATAASRFLAAPATEHPRRDRRD